MAYVDQLERHDPFTFCPPEIYAPWAARLIGTLRQEFTRIGWAAADIRRMARALDVYLGEYAQRACIDPGARADILEIGYADATIQAIEKVTSGSQLRAVASDLALYLASPVTVFALASGQPPGVREIEGFEILASLSLWKMAESIDLLANQKKTIRSFEAATRLATESMAAGNMALALENSIQALATEVSGIQGIAKQAATEVHDQVQARRSAIGAVGAKARATRYDASRKLVLKMALECGHYKQSAAMLDIAERLEKEHGISLKPSTVKAYLCDAGWPRMYIPHKSSKTKKR